MAESKHLIVGNTNQDINRLIAAEHSQARGFTTHYNQSEEMFLQFDTSLRIPSLPIHHDVRNPDPSREYTKGIISVIEGVMESLPGLLNGLKYYFDPGDVHRPTFYQLYKIGDDSYVYQLKFDLTFHPSHHRVIKSGSNDYAPEFETNKLVVEADVIPLTRIDKMNGFPALYIEQSISETWIGETGRGYFVQGIWLDRELTKFFSRLFMEEGKKIYPYYPVTCKYQAICQSLNVFTSQARRVRLSAHHNIRKFLLRYLNSIESALRHNEFSENLEAYRMIRDKVPEKLREIWKNTRVEIYLNENDMREYLIEDELF